MKVKLLQAVVGMVDGHRNPPSGAVLEVSGPAGALLCDRGIAEPVVEKATEKRPAAKRSEKRG